MQQLDPKIHVAVLLDPGACVAMQWVPAIRGGIEPADDSETGQADALEGQSWRRTSAGHRVASMPCVLNSAMTMRSSPKPRHAVLATAPSLVRMSHFEPKCSWWKLKE